MSPTSLRIVALGLLLAPVVAVAQTSLPKQSPFAPAGGSAVAAPGTDEAFEFFGVSAIGKKTDVIIHDKSTKRKHWIAVGETVDGISVVKYDPAREQAVIRVHGAEKTLALRKPTRAGQGPTPAQAAPVTFNVPPAPVVQTTPAPAEAIVQKIQPPPPPAEVPAAQPATAPAVPQTPEAQAKAETEARMLVSDLLEIGMAQRKAYEEAQRNAAGRGSEQPIPPPQNQQPPGAVPPQQPIPAQPTPAAPAQPGND